MQLVVGWTLMVALISGVWAGCAEEPDMIKGMKRAKAQKVASFASASNVMGVDTSLSSSSSQRSWALRLCNAYAYEGWLHVFHSLGRRSGMAYTTNTSDDGETRLTTESGPLPFKRCVDVADVPIAVGSLLKFRIGGDMHIGSFSVNELPAQGSMLQLVLKRRDTWSTAASFSSNVFVDMPGPQVALVDAYLGKAKSVLEVRDVPTGFEHLADDAPSRLQEVHFGTVVDVALGNYEWWLMDADVRRRHTAKATVEFKAAGRTIYTVLRVGAAALAGESFPEELIVWPADGAIVRGASANSGHDDKGLFGIPKQFHFRKSPHRSSAKMCLVDSFSLVLIAALSIAVSGPL